MANSGSGARYKISSNTVKFNDNFKPEKTDLPLKGDILTGNYRLSGELEKEDIKNLPTTLRILRDYMENDADVLTGYITGPGQEHPLCFAAETAAPVLIGSLEKLVRYCPIAENEFYKQKK
jgi:hypothetical protein